MYVHIIISWSLFLIKFFIISNFILFESSLFYHLFICNFCFFSVHHSFPKLNCIYFERMNSLFPSFHFNLISFHFISLSFPFLFHLSLFIFFFFFFDIRLAGMKTGKCRLPRPKIILPNEAYIFIKNFSRQIIPKTSRDKQK